jgi:hypothetical protein
MSVPRSLLVAVFFVLLAGFASAQAYVADLKNEDIASLDQHLKASGTTYRAEPLLAAYLAFGSNPDFVSQLLQKGCNPNQRAPGSASPLTTAVLRNLNPAIVGLLLQAGASLEARVPGASGSVIDVALDKQAYETASLLIKANQRSLPASRLAPADRYKDYPAFFLDDLVQVRNSLRYGDFGNALVWNLALAGNSRKVLTFLMGMGVDANLNDPETHDENQVGLGLLASNLDLLSYLLANGLARDQVNFDKLWTLVLGQRNLDAFRSLKVLDPGVRPGLYRPALAAGMDFLRAATDNLQDLTKPDLYSAFDAQGSGAAYLSALLYGAAGAPTPPLVIAVYQQSDAATVLPLIAANPSEPGLINLYLYAFGKKDLALVKALVGADPKGVRPELYAPALAAGIDALKAVTHDLADLKTPALYRDAGKDNGVDNLTSVLLRPQTGRALLESLYEKTDFATTLAIIQALNPPRELLAGRSFSSAYQAWLNRGNKDITSFGFPRLAKATVQDTQITVELPAGTDVKALVAEFTLSGGSASVAGVNQVSGTTANNFAAPVSYLVTAADGTQKVYVVTVTVKPAPAVTPPPAPAPVATPPPAAVPQTAVPVPAPDADAAAAAATAPAPAAEAAPAPGTPAPAPVAPAQ